MILTLMVDGAIEMISFSPDDEPTNVTSGSELQKVQIVHLDCVTTRNVPKGFGKTLVLVVHDKRSQLLNMTSVPQLSFASSHPSGGVHLGNIGPGLVPPKEFHCLL